MIACRSDITRVYYTIHSASPYVVYPPQSVQGTVPASRAVQKISILPGGQNNQLLQSAIRTRRQAVPASTATLSNINERYCYDPLNDKYIPYNQADLVTTSSQPLANSDGSASSNFTASIDCKGCICDIPVFTVLLREHANVSTPAARSQLAQDLLAPWLSRYANVTQDVSNIPPSNWSSYVIGQPDYKFHDGAR